MQSGMADIFHGMMMQMLLYYVRNMRNLEMLVRRNWINLDFIFRITEIQKVIGGAMEKLQIISIELESSDDAQLIFESLNSTGLALTEADKIRNYLLMSLSREEQQEYFKKYWQKIELSTGNEPTMFLRDYLTIIQQLQRPPRINLLYFEWKKYMEERDRKVELAKMLDYAKFYYQATNAQLSTEKLSKKMRQICNIQTDVFNVFFIPFLKYAEDKELSESEIYNVIDLIENFMARRIVCNIPGNALTQVFCALHKDVLKSYEEYKDAGIVCPYRYAEILTYHIMRRDGNYPLNINSLYL